ncbi:MAG: DUF481 domain-containing protein [Parvibaculales bacterium]
MGKPSGIIGGFNHLPNRISGKLFILLALGWLMAGPAHATVIVRQLDPTPEGWSIGLEGSYDDQSGSTEKRDYSAAFNILRKTGAHEWRAFGSLAYGRVNGVENENQGLVHVRYVRALTGNPLRVETFIQTEQDDFANMAERSLLGGVVSRFFNSGDGERRVLAMVGLMRESEEHLTNDTLDREVTRLTSSLQMSWLLPRDNKLYFISYLQPNIDAPENDMRVTAELSLAIPLSDRLSLRTGYYYRYNDMPFDDIPREKKRLSTGFAYRF